jgi:hypothetical protein
VHFSIGSSSFSIDPNRMFTAAGRRRHLIPFRQDADLAVAQFATQLLRVYQFESQNIVLALHNNGPGYSAESYLPGLLTNVIVCLVLIYLIGGEFASAAQSVSIGTLFIRNQKKQKFFFFSSKN